MKRDRCLIVLEPLEDRAVDDDLVILQFPPDHAKRVVHLMMVQLDFGEPRGTATRYPFLVHVVVHHYRRTSGRYAHFAGTKEDRTILHTLSQFTMRMQNFKIDFQGFCEIFEDVAKISYRDRYSSEVGRIRCGRSEYRLIVVPRVSSIPVSVDYSEKSSAHNLPSNELTASM